MAIKTFTVFNQAGERVVSNEGEVTFETTSYDSEQHLFSVVDKDDCRSTYRVPFKGFLIAIEGSK